MADRLVTVCSCATPVEADLVRGALDASGIASSLGNDSMASWLWQLAPATGGVSVLVPEEDVPRARLILEQAEIHRRHDKERVAATAGEGTRICPRCGEPIPAEFDICWKCDAEAADRELGEVDPDADFLDETAETSDASQAAIALPARPLAGPTWTCANCGAAVTVAANRCDFCGADRRGEVNPYFTRAIEPPAAQSAGLESSDALTLRAWRAAIIGLFLFPPLLFNAYSLWLLLRVAAIEVQLSKRTSRLWLASLAVDLVATGLTFVVYRIIYGQP